MVSLLNCCLAFLTKNLALVNGGLNQKKQKTTGSNMEVSFNQSIESQPAGITRTIPRFDVNGPGPTEAAAAKRVLLPAWFASMWCCEIVVRRGDLPCQDPLTSVRIIKEG